MSEQSIYPSVNVPFELLVLLSDYVLEYLKSQLPAAADRDLLDYYTMMIQYPDMIIPADFCEYASLYLTQGGHFNSPNLLIHALSIDIKEPEVAPEYAEAS